MSDTNISAPEHPKQSANSQPDTQRSNSRNFNPIVLVGSLIAVAIAAVAAYVVGRGSRPNDTYLKEGAVQFRVDERLGRTDRLGSSGWEPFSYDGSSVELPSSVVILDNGTWDSGFGTPPPGRICFDAHNNSASVIQDVKVSVSFNPKPADYPSGAGSDNTDPLDLILGEYSILKPDRGNLLGGRKDGRLCGTAPRVFPTGAKWSYRVLRVRGWQE